ncbi:hypothetical protein JJ685_08075 [Ramlibacter monticola]|uniref:Uncharacterized protein n=1 Tax=Ramlibacter monticola TaxID=1926872 RepID=A0A937CTI2_9BURK|nr:hypothetical protein [Ramlibacter monticola]
MQRLLSVAADARTHDSGQIAVIPRRCVRHPQRPVSKVLLTLPSAAANWTRERPLARGLNWHSRPVANLRLTELGAENQSFDPSRFRLMRGSDRFIEGLFTMRRPDDFVPANHPLRRIRVMAREALVRMNGLFSRMYAGRRQGRPTRHLAGGGQGPAQRTRVTSAANKPPGRRRQGLIATFSTPSRWWAKSS